MKTKKELKDLKARIGDLDEKLAELNQSEFEKVTKGLILQEEIVTLKKEIDELDENEKAFVLEDFMVGIFDISKIHCSKKEFESYY